MSKDIKVGDLVEINEHYLGVLGGAVQVGKRFVVTGIVHREWRPLEGESFTYYARGDDRGFGLWFKYLDKVEVPEAEVEPKYLPGTVILLDVSGVDGRAAFTRSRDGIWRPADTEIDYLCDEDVTELLNKGKVAA